MRPSERIFDSGTGRMPDTPEFKVFDSVIAWIAILVMHTLVFVKISTERTFHGEDMFEDISTIHGPRVRWSVHPDVAWVDLNPTALPGWVIFA